MSGARVATESRTVPGLILDVERGRFVVREKPGTTRRGTVR